MNGPTFVALDTRGSPATTWLYVSEHGETNGTGGGRILRFNLTSGSTTPQIVASAGTADGQFVSPDGIVVDPATGDLFIADRYLNRIQRISVNQTTGAGTMVMKWGSSTAGAPDEMHGPLGLARDSAGAIYVTEHGDTNGGGVTPNTVAKYTISGTTATRVWRRGNDFNIPYGITVSGSTLLISDGFNARVQIWDLNGNPTGSFTLAGTIPLGLSTDSTGAVWIAESSDNGNGTIQQVERRTAAGASTGMSFGTRGSGNGEFLLPFDAVLDSATNRVYVADYSNDRVEVISLAAAPPADTTAPTVASFSAGTASGSSVPFTITFSEPVTGVAATAFTASGAGSTVASVTPVSTTTYTVNVNFTGTSGTITLSLNASANTSIRDASNNFYAGGGTTSATYTIPSTGGGDTTNPIVASSSWALGPNPTNENASFIVIFSEPVTGVDASDFAINRTGTTNGNVTEVTGSGTTYTVSFFYDGTAGFTGSIQMAIKTSGTGIVDASGNPFLGGGTTASAPIPVNGTVLADGTLPTVTSLTAGTPSGSTVNFTLTFSEAVTGVDAADFFTTRTGSATAQIGAVTGSGTTYTVPVTFGGSGTVQLTVVGGASANIRDAATHWFGGGGNSTSAAFTLPAAGSAPVIAAQTASGTQNAAFSYQVVATGATSFSILGTPALPAGLTMNSSGLITGTPTTAGTTTVTVRATNTVGSTDAALTITISPASTGTAPVIANQSASGTQNAAFSYQVAATGATSFSIVGTPALPAGLTMSAAGLITGTPTTAGTTTVTVRATNTTGSTNALLTITIAPASTGTAPVIANQTASGTQNTAFSYQVVATGATSFSIVGTPALPAGLTMSSSGLITGTPTAAGTTAVTVRATNATGSTNATLTITIAPATTGGSAPVVTSATVNGTVGVGLSHTIVATNSPTSFTITSGTLPSGLSLAATTGVISGTPQVAGSSSVTVRATNSSGSGTGTVSFAIASAPTPPPPTGGGGGGGGGGGVFLLPQTITIAPVGDLVVGTPVTLSGSSNAGLTPIVFSVLSGNATIAENVLTPRATGEILVRASQSGGGLYMAAYVDVTLVAKSGQTVTFNSPVSAITIDQPVALSATSSAGLPVTFSLVSGDATISGTTLTPKGLAPIVVRATAAGNDDFAAASTDVNFGSPQKAAQGITFALGDVSVLSGPITLNATSTSGLPVTYTLISGPATLNGNVLTLTRASGVVTIRASQSGNDLYNATEVLRSFNVGAIGQQVFLGTIGTDPFAVIISADNRRGMFLTRFAATGEAIVAKFDLNANGTFRASAASALPASDEGVVLTTDTPATAAAGQVRTITGTVSNGTVNGTIAELGQTFTATGVPPTGSTASFAGVYTATIPGSASGETYIVVGPTGQAFAVAITPFGVISGTGTITTDGAVDITTSSGDSIVGSIDATGALRGTLRTGSTTAALVGLSEATNRSDRLVNLSSRLRVVSGDASRSVIAGFVVSGTESKQVLVRAIGPGLTAFGVTGALSNPRLQLYNGSTLVAENDDWSNSTEVATTGDSVGAFKLNNSSRDSALVANLAPGAYTAVVSGVGGDGVALIEVYDAASNTALAAPQLVNISTRGFVDTGEGNLIAGFVVTGNAPKRVLIRGIGPGLSQFNVPGVVTDPVLRLYAAGSSTVIAENDNWSTPQAINASQIAATATEIASASSASGAFPLPANSRDAAIVITLEPGQYSAVVSGLNNATGAGLVEVYELSNP